MVNQTSKTESVKIRRAPKFLPFLLTGGVIGIVLALIVGLAIPEQQRTAQPIITYLLAYFGGIGVALGIVAAVVADRVGLARAKSLEATKLKG